MCRIKIKIQRKIYDDYKAGHAFTKIGRRLYSIQHNPMAATHTWIVGRDSENSDWYWVQPLDLTIR